MQLNLKIEQLSNDDSVYLRADTSNLSEDLQKKVLDKCNNNHIFSEEEVDQINQGIWSG